MTTERRRRMAQTKILYKGKTAFRLHTSNSKGISERKFHTFPSLIVRICLSTICLWCLLRYIPLVLLVIWALLKPLLCPCLEVLWVDRLVIITLSIRFIVNQTSLTSGMSSSSNMVPQSSRNSEIRRNDIFEAKSLRLLRMAPW